MAALAPPSPSEDPIMKLVQSKYGWWVHGQNEIALVPPTAVASDGNINPVVSEDLRNRGLFEAPVDDEVYYLTVLTATDCNMGCGYCFQNTGLAPEGSYRQPRLRSARLDESTLQQLLMFTQAQMEAQSKTGLHILLFGGEPLMNPRGCIELLRRSQALGLVGANMISNGYLLKPTLARELEEAGLQRVKITFDGAQNVHDSIRATRAGRPTYSKIIDNIQRCTSETNLEWNIRINISHNNVASIAELVNDLATSLDGSRCTVDFAIVDDVGIGYRNELTQDEDGAYSDEVYELLVDLNITMLSAGFDVAPVPSLSECMYCKDMGSKNGAVVNADGVLYSCWESAGKPGWEVGTLAHGYLNDSELGPKWVACDYDRVGPKQSALDHFFDRVEARVLDWKYANDRL